MNTAKREPTIIAKEFQQWISNAACDFDTAVTLTFRNDPETTDHACQQFTYFMNKLNDACFGNNWSRRAKHDPRARIAVLPIIENGFGTKRLHYHCLFERPAHISHDKFQLLIYLCWDETRNGGNIRNDVQMVYDSLGFMGYMTKELRVNDFDKLDEKNIHIY